MLSGGDEIGRTQLGNNNAWCQDNELSWYDWELDERREHLLAFTKRLIALRREHAIFVASASSTASSDRPGCPTRGGFVGTG